MLGFWGWSPGVLGSTSTRPRCRPQFYTVSGYEPLYGDLLVESGNEKVVGGFRIAWRPL